MKLLHRRHRRVEPRGERRAGDWACDVCGSWRPPDRIDTTTGRDDLTVRYCNDRPSCVEGAERI